MPNFVDLALAVDSKTREGWKLVGNQKYLKQYWENMVEGETFPEPYDDSITVTLIDVSKISNTLKIHTKVYGKRIMLLDETNRVEFMMGTKEFANIAAVESIVNGCLTGEFKVNYLSNMFLLKKVG